MEPKQAMKLAIEKCRRGIRQGQTPFGACIVKRGKVIACEHNTVWRTTDITAHAEMNAIRTACRKLRTVDLSGCTIYSTCEPCPMCFSACHWARISRIVYGTRIEDAKRIGFNELQIPSKRIQQITKSPLKVKGNFMRREALELFTVWAARKDKKAY